MNDAEFREAVVAAMKQPTGTQGLCDSVRSLIERLDEPGPDLPRIKAPPPPLPPTAQPPPAVAKSVEGASMPASGPVDRGGNPLKKKMPKKKGPGAGPPKGLKTTAGSVPGDD